MNLENEILGIRTSLGRIEGRMDEIGKLSRHGMRRLPRRRIPICPRANGRKHERHSFSGRKSGR